MTTAAPIDSTSGARRLGRICGWVGVPLLAIYAVGIALTAAELGTMLEDPQGGLGVFVVMLLAAWWLVGLVFTLLGVLGGRGGRHVLAAVSLVLVTVWLYLPGGPSDAACWNR